MTHQNPAAQTAKPAATNRRFYSLMGFVAVSMLSAIALSQSASAGTLKINIDGMENIKGNVMLAIFDHADFFPSKTERAVTTAMSAVVSETMTITVADLPPGKYGLSVYHDENGNGEFDRNFMGVPSELYGFSNNVRGFAGPPEFEETLITVTDDQKTISIGLE